MTNGTVSHHKDKRNGNSLVEYLTPLPGHIALSANTTYRIAVKPTTTTSVVLNSFDVNTANYLQAFPRGTAFRYTDRVDAGSWAAATTTRVPLLWFRAIGFDDAVQTGGLVIVNE